MRPARRFSAGLVAGLLAASATAGLLVGFGLRTGTADTLFALGGRQLVGLPVRDGVAVTLGVLRHLLAFLALGFLAAAVAGSPRMRARTRALLLLLLVALVWAARHLLPTVLLPLAVEMPWQPALLYHLVTFVTLHLGIRLAFGVRARREPGGTITSLGAYSTQGDDRSHV